MHDVGLLVGYESLRQHELIKCTVSNSTIQCIAGTFVLKKSIAGHFTINRLARNFTIQETLLIFLYFHRVLFLLVGDHVILLLDVVYYHTQNYLSVLGKTNVYIQFFICVLKSLKIAF